MKGKFTGRCFYYDNVLCILFNEDMDIVGEHGILNINNYSFIDDRKNNILLKDIWDEVTFCNMYYNENIVSFKVKDKEILKNYNLRFGAVLLKEINYIINKKGEVYGLCDGYDIVFYDRELELADFDIKMNDKFTIELVCVSEIFIKELMKDDLIVKSNEKQIAIKEVVKKSARKFKIKFEDEILQAGDVLTIGTKQEFHGKASKDILDRPMKRGDLAYIKNEINPTLKKISLVELIEDKVKLELDFDIGILKYSSNDFEVKVENEIMLSKGHSNYLKKGEVVGVNIENLSGIDVSDPNVYVKVKELGFLFTTGYNQKMISASDYIKVESFFASYGVLEVGSEINLILDFNRTLKQIDKADVEYLISKKDGIITLSNKVYGSVNIYYEDEVPIVSESSIKCSIKSKYNKLIVKWDKLIFDELKGFVYADYIGGENFRSADGVRALREFNLPIEYKEIKESYIFCKGSDFGEEWSLFGGNINVPVILEVDNLVPYRYYGSKSKITRFNKGLRLIYIEKSKNDIDVEVDFCNIECNEFIVDTDKDLKINFNTCRLRNLKKL